ncbi:MAG: hypothetical protein ACFFCI_17790 [Promethearchaeota archaeon]
MDTGEDFVTPEFLDILFFQQKNVVIFPYVDLKHLHALEMFTAGHNVVDLESTALHDLRNILEFESTNTYSQNPTLYFIYNLNESKIRELMSIRGLRCILNTSENVSKLANGSQFVFYNKKSNQYLNYTPSDLQFEKFIISSSSSKTILQDTIQSIKITASKIFEGINQEDSTQTISQLLSNFDPQYWQKILDFTNKYFQVRVPDVSELKGYRPVPSSQHKSKQDFKDFTQEYEILVSSNRILGKEFIQILHNWRNEHVDGSHLDLDILFNPLKLYNYLRNHHWKEGIPEKFLKEWMEMNLSQYTLTESDISDFQTICTKLSLPDPNPHRDLPLINEPEISFTEIDNQVPSVRNFPQFKRWILSTLEDIESLLNIPPNKKPTRIVVDITNILYKDLNEDREIKIKNLLSIRNSLITQGYDPYLIADASTQHNVDDKNSYKEYLRKKYFSEAPAGRTADKYVLKHAQQWKCKFITNDMYRDYWEEFGEEWVLSNRVTFMVTNGQLILD